uniref:hypothetical protein n=1 Tax=Faecalicatena contorta TaxID=39482 RepID=UPI00359CB5C0
MKEKLIKGFLALAALLTFSGMECKAEIAGDDAFSNLAWEQVFEENLIGSVGVVQSICATDDYIICIENTGENQDPDVVSAYYKNKVDKDGNPVEQYSLAKRVNDMNWEHGNGMAYNPGKNEIYVALYTNIDPENRGCLYVMDPDTLGFKGKIKISDNYNILGIDYKEDTDQYIIQTNVDDGYSFKILNSEFQVVDELGSFPESAKGYNFQDLAVCGDYIFNFPLTLDWGTGDFLHVYSISRRTMVTAPQLDFRFDNVTHDEPESLCEIEPGVFLAAVNVTNTAGERMIRFYKTEMPYYFQVTVKGENGTVSESGKVLRGESFPVTYQAEDGYELSSLSVNGVEEDIEKYQDGYSLTDIREDCEIQVSFTKIQPAAVPKVNSGGTHIRIPVPAAAGSAAGACMVIGFGFFLFHIRMERKRKLSYARELRRQIILDMA